MRWPLSWLVLLLCNAGPLFGAGVSLENDSLRLQWDQDRGGLVSLVDKASGRDWLDSASPSPVYSILLAGEKTPVTSADAAQVRVFEKSGAVVIEARHDRPTALQVTCRFWAEKGSPHLLGRIAVHAAEAVRIDEVRFPLVMLRQPFSGTGDDDRLLWPECDGTLLSNPGKNRPDRTLRYPGGCSLQMMAAFDPTAGLYMAARDHEGYTKTFNTRRVGKSALEMSISHVLAQTPTTQWDLGYDVDLAALRPSPGLDRLTWEAAADLYRPWAVRQPWCRQTMAQRAAAGDIPKWLIEPTLVVTFSLRGQMPDGKPGNRQPMVVDQARRWSKLVGAPVTMLTMSWEKLDSWTTPDYFPPFGGQEPFEAMTRQLHAEGHHTMVYLSGLHWTLHKQLGKPEEPSVVIDQEEDFNRRGRASAIGNSQGEADIVGTPTKGVGQHATICSTTPMAEEVLVGSSARCEQLGIDCVQVDQIVGGGMKACFHPKHNHPPGGGNWCTQAIYKLFGEIRKQGKARSPDFAFSIEEPNEFYLPLLDTYHARDLHQGRWPRSGAGVLGVPLFTHVYHDYVAGYGSEGCYVSESPNKVAMYQIGMNLVCGKVPSVALWGRWCEPEKLDPPQQRLLRAHIDLWRGPAGPFLTFGQRVASPALDVPMIDILFKEKTGTPRPLQVPAVLQGTYRLPDGRQGTVLACIADKPVEFTFGAKKLKLEPGEAVFQ